MEPPILMVTTAAQHSGHGIKTGSNATLTSVVRAVREKVNGEIQEDRSY